jgi:hypothetical protein
MVMPTVALGTCKRVACVRGLLTVVRHTLMPPPGYTIAGVSGSCGQWVDGFQLIITR